MAKVNAPTADDIISALAHATPGTRAAILADCSVRMLRAVADLTYATEYPDAHGRVVLTRAILATFTDPTGG